MQVAGPEVQYAARSRLILPSLGYANPVRFT
jgi:hypothetical protein